MRKNPSKRLVNIAILSVVLLAVFISVFFIRPKKDTPQSNALIYLGQQSTNELLSALQDREESLESLDLSALYPIYTESQSSSELCWAYASCKALETSIMLQEGEYTNFSEVGMALLYYQYMKSAGTPIELFSMGNFDYFNIVAQQYGLVYENDFSNSFYYRLNNDNVGNFDYLGREADKSLSKRYLPVNIFDSQTYLSATSEDRTRLLKSFIKNYGGFFAGIKSGYLYLDGDYGIYSSENSGEGGIPINSHAVCIIGYSDEHEGFLALNSWNDPEGFAYEKFIIPYTAEEVIGTFKGYVMVQNRGETKIETSSNAGGFKEVLSGCPLKNVFTLKELSTFELCYKFSNAGNFSSVYAQISSNGTDYSKKFSFVYRDDEQTVRVSYCGGGDFDAGTYLIKFYSSKGLLATKTLYFYSGTEISYAALYERGGTYLMLDSYALFNTFAGGNNTATFYVYFEKEFNLRLYYTYLSRNLQANISDMYVYNGEYKKDSLSFAKIDKNQNTLLSVDIDLEQVGSILGFTLELSQGEFTEKFYIRLIVSSFEAQTEDAYEIFYMTDGGENPKENIDKAPKYLSENVMTDFVLREPVKEGYIFEGWYLEPNFSGERVEKIDSKIKSDTVLYAKWRATTEVEFSGELKLETEQIIRYGDDFNVEYHLIESKDIVGTNYLLVYELSVDGVYRAGGTVSGSSGLVIPFQFTYSGNIGSTRIGIGAGNVQIRVSAKLVADHSETIEKGSELLLSVERRELTANYIEERLVYDTNFHLPKVELVGLLPNDSAQVLFDLSAQRDAGKYTFNIVGVSNSNYTLGETEALEFDIEKKPIKVKWADMIKTYNGMLQYPSVEFVGVLGEETMFYNYVVISKDNALATNFVSAGNYRINVELEDCNYRVSESEEQEFLILKRELRIEIDDITQRVQVAPEDRERPSYRLLDSAVHGDNLGLEIRCEALRATKSGEYSIDASVKNSNYVLKVKGGTYTLTGYYLVHYTLPDGSIYIERVEEGCAPKGVDSKVYKKPLFSRFVYSRQLSPSSEDMYVAVSTSSYLWVVAVVSAVLILGVLYFIFNRKVFKSKVR